MTYKGSSKGGKNMRRKTMKKKCCDATYIGINKWFKHVFEHLGWMVLAKSRGHMDKVMVYKESVNRLKDAIEERMHFMKDADKKQDLQILHRDVMILMEHINKDFP